MLTSKWLRNANVVLTGASYGIGRELAVRILQSEAKLVAVARSETHLRALEIQLSPFRPRLTCCVADITDNDGRQRIADLSSSTFGSDGVDILFNNAAVSPFESFLSLSEGTIARVIDTNLLAPLLLARALLPGMLQRRRGVVVSMSSVSGKVGLPFNAAYSASKAGLIAWGQALYSEIIQGSGVRLLTIIPSVVHTHGVSARSGQRTPRIIGEVSCDDIFRCFSRFLGTDKEYAEVIVSRFPLRPLLAISALAPRFPAFATEALGVKKMYAAVAAKNVTANGPKQPDL